MNKNLVIAIPSRGRAKRLDFSQLTNFIINLYVREEEYKDYNDNVKDTNVLIHKVPNEIHLCQKRQYIIEKAYKENIEHLLMLDDDIVFFKLDKNKKLIKLTLNETQTMINNFVKLNSYEFPVVHAIQRAFSNYRKYMFEKNIRAIRAVMFHIPFFIRNKIDYRYMYNKYGSEYKEDIDVQIQFLNKGVNTIGFCRYIVEDRGYNRNGGVSLFRKDKTFNLSAISLKKEYPNFVSLVRKGDRLDCRINYKKFLKENELSYLPKKETIKQCNLDI